MFTTRKLRPALTFSAEQTQTKLKGSKRTCDSADGSVDSSVRNKFYLTNKRAQCSWVHVPPTNPVADCSGCPMGALWRGGRRCATEYRTCKKRYCCRMPSFGGCVVFDDLVESRAGRDFDGRLRRSFFMLRNDSGFVVALRFVDRSYNGMDWRIDRVIRNWNQQLIGSHFCN